MNKSKKCPVCNGTGWIKSKAEEVAQLARISGLLPEEMSLRSNDFIFTRLSIIRILMGQYQRLYIHSN